MVQILASWVINTEGPFQTRLRYSACSTICADSHRRTPLRLQLPQLVSLHVMINTLARRSFSCSTRRPAIAGAQGLTPQWSRHPHTSASPGGDNRRPNALAAAHANVAGPRCLWQVAWERGAARGHARRTACTGTNLPRSEEKK